MTAGYRRLHFLVEGQTEEIVVDSVLEPYLLDQGWTITKSIVTTKRPATGPASRGGVSSWAKLEQEIRVLLRSSDIHTLAILFDYYGFSVRQPGHEEQAGILRIRASRTCREVAGVGDFDLADRLRRDVRGAGGPELVNDGFDTAPSKRLTRYCAGYSKTNDGPLAIADLGIDALRSQCPHLDSWLTHLDARID